MSNEQFQRPMERRIGNRLPCRAPVRIYVDPQDATDSFFLESTDLSHEGVFLHTDLLFPEGEWLDLEFVVPGRAQPVRGLGRVVRVHTSSAPPGPGMAIHLPQLEREERSALSRMATTPVRVVS